MYLQDTHTETELDLSPAAQAVCELFARIAPDVADSVAPFVQRLFAASANGDTFVYVSHSDVALLQQAAPLVGNDDRSPLVLDGKRLFLAKSWHLERELATQIQRLSQQECRLPAPDIITPKLQTWFADAGSHDQQAACTLALIKPFVLISGGPGTGKTTTVAKLLALLCDEAALPRIALVAPTGKAAARLSQALRGALSRMTDLSPAIAAHLNALDGQTAHRLLGIKPPTLNAEYDSNNPLVLDMVLIDEASMLDNHLFYQLLCALPDTCRVVLLGDADQLPSVGVGAILTALSTQSQVQAATLAQLQRYLPTRSDWRTVAEQFARLTLSHRFDSQSGIGQFAAAIRTGSLHHRDDVAQLFTQFPQALLQQHGSAKQLAEQMWQQHRDYWQAIDAGDVQAAFAWQNRLIALTALRFDAQQINQAYRQIAQQHQRVSSSDTWFAGQMLLIIRNAPAQKLYNGDVGIVMQPAQSKGLVACFPDENAGYRTVPLSRLPEHESAFAMTVHKSQGSEYDSVWYFAPSHSTASRALLYTAVTRTKQQFVYWGDLDSAVQASQHHVPRQTGLANFLQADR